MLHWNLNPNPYYARTHSRPIVQFGLLMCFRFGAWTRRARDRGEEREYNGLDAHKCRPVNHIRKTWSFCCDRGTRGRAHCRYCVEHESGFGNLFNSWINWMGGTSTWRIRFCWNLNGTQCTLHWITTLEVPESEIIRLISYICLFAWIFTEKNTARCGYCGAWVKRTNTIH